MSPINKKILQKKIAVILAELPHLKLLLKAKIDFENDFKSAYALLFSIQKAIAATLDLASHIIVNETKDVPDTYAEAIRKLGVAGFLPKKFAEDFSSIAGFRNKVVHGYDEIDFKKVVDLLPRVIMDLEKFVKEIEKHF